MAGSALNNGPRGKIVALMGAPGAGKGSVAAECVRRFGWSHISTGDICRRFAAMGGEIGTRIDTMLRSGRLIPDDLMAEMLQAEIGNEVRSAPVVILDGFPRTEAQVLLLDDLMSDFTWASLGAILLDLPDDVAAKRMTSRLVCGNKECQAVYSVEQDSALSPRVSGKCELCGAALVRRDDDVDSVVRRRIAGFRKVVEPVVECYRGRGVLAVVDACRSISDVTTSLVEKVGKLFPDGDDKEQNSATENEGGGANPGFFDGGCRGRN